MDKIREDGELPLHRIIFKDYGRTLDFLLLKLLLTSIKAREGRREVRDSRELQKRNEEESSQETERDLCRE